MRGPQLCAGRCDNGSLAMRLPLTGHIAGQPIDGITWATLDKCGGRSAKMGTIIVKRLPRRPAPEIPAGELLIDPPPEIPQASGGKWQQALMMLPMLGGTLSM